MKTLTMHCRTCIYYDAHFADDDSSGCCKVAPPIAHWTGDQIENDLNPDGYWPAISFNEWCGKWIHKGRADLTFKVYNDTMNQSSRPKRN